jgi:hypothetical protein
VAPDRDSARRSAKTLLDPVVSFLILLSSAFRAYPKLTAPSNTTMSSNVTQLSNREIVRVMYRETSPPSLNALACTVCDRVIKQKRGLGYKTLISHLHQHPGFEHAALAAIQQKGGAKPAVSFFMDKGAKATFRWLELKNLPLTFVGDEVMRRSVSSILSPTIRLLNASAAPSSWWRKRSPRTSRTLGFGVT